MRRDSSSYRTPLPVGFGASSTIFPTTLLSRYPLPQTKAAIYTKHSTRSTGSWPGQPIAPLAQLTQPAPSVAGVTATISHAAENVAEAVRSGLSRIGL